MASVVSAISNTSPKSADMNVLSTSVAVAVDQRRGATCTIAQNAQEALVSAVEVVHVIFSIEDTSAATKLESNQVLDAGDQLSRQSDDLHVEFGKFIADVRAA